MAISDLAIHHLTRNLPRTKSDRIKLAFDLLPNAAKRERKTWNRTRLTKLSECKLIKLILGWAFRAQKGKVTHLLALGTTPACLEEKGHEATLIETFTTPIATEGSRVTCRGCRTSCGLPTPEERAEFLRLEEEQIASDSGRRRKAGGRTSKGKTINTERFASLASNGTVPLSGTYRGATHAAILNADGTVTFGGETFPSLSRAACTARQTQTCNGWAFWTLSNGESADWLRGTSPFEVTTLEVTAA